MQPRPPLATNQTAASQFTQCGEMTNESTGSNGRHRTGLLVSVRNAIEAQQVATNGCVDIIDVKEPALGSLGAVSPKVAGGISQAVTSQRRTDRVMLSIALGEVCDQSGWASFSPEIWNKSLCGFQIAKVGLAGLRDRPNWRETWSNFLGMIPDSMMRVAVAYVDPLVANSPDIQDVLTTGVSLDCKYLLLDTFEKQNGGLFDLRSTGEIQTVIESARQLDVKIVLAGSISLKTVTKAIELEPDYIAVRGAACGENRESPICERVLNEFTEVFGESSGCALTRQSLDGSAFHGGAMEREEPVSRGTGIERNR